MKEARERKAWAERTAKNRAWAAGASDMSKESLAKALRETVDEMARYALAYTHYRASLGWGYNNQNAVDPAARREWLELGGTLPERK